MKMYCLFFLMFTLAWNCLFGQIKNGYGSEINGVRESLKSLNTLVTADSGLSLFQRARIKIKINRLATYVNYYELTEELLLQFRTIAPELYNEIDALQDCDGQNVSVYVKFVPECELQQGIAGTTNIACLEGDKNVYYSEYGPRTVSVRIASMKSSLFVLAHEFGHVKYQVANLATYIEFYSGAYQNGIFNSSYIGHNFNDPSGRKALENESIFRGMYLSFLKTAGVKMESPVALLQAIRKTHDEVNHTWLRKGRRKYYADTRDYRLIPASGHYRNRWVSPLWEDPEPQ